MASCLLSWPFWLSSLFLFFFSLTTSVSIYVATQVTGGDASLIKSGDVFGLGQYFGHMRDGEGRYTVRLWYQDYYSRQVRGGGGRMGDSICHYLLRISSFCLVLRLTRLHSPAGVF